VRSESQKNDERGKARREGKKKFEFQILKSLPAKKGENVGLLSSC
jgi:hypothetical protein